MNKTILQSLHERPIAYYPIYRKITGTTTAGILLSQLMYWFSKKEKIYKTNAEIMGETLLTENELRSAKKKIKALPFISITLEGVPAKTFYEINWDIYKLFMNNEIQNPQLDAWNPRNKGCEIHPSITESTTETTTEPKVSCPTSSSGDEKEIFKPAETKNPTPPSSAPPPTNPTKKQPAVSETAIKIAEKLSESILKRDEHYHTLTQDKKAGTIKRWANDIEKIHRLDKRSWDEISAVLSFVVSDDFWSRNILSGAKLRKQFSALKLKLPTTGTSKAIPIRATKHSDTHVKIFFLDKKLSSGGCEFKIITKSIARQNVDSGLWEVCTNVSK